MAIPNKQIERTVSIKKIQSKQRTYQLIAQLILLILDYIDIEIDNHDLL